jgi:phenylacetate-CoA ligase
MDVDSVITEFVDKDGNPVSAGEHGEIVHTSLFNFVMPFIRYSIGDVGRPSEDECPCGRVLPLMEVVEGRADSFVVLPDGKLISPRAFTVAMSMFEYYEGIEQFRIIQRKIDCFDVLLKIKRIDLTESDVAERLKLHFQKLLGFSAKDVTFNVSFVDEIPLSKTGRLTAVVSEVARTM